MKPIRAIAIADTHCGSPRMDPLHFLHCIRTYLIPEITEDKDFLFVCGDFFDLLINMNSVASVVALTVISELKTACSKANVKLRVLRGTFTHDRNQPKHFLSTSPEYNSCVQLFDTMSIEYDADTDTSILYMPDNLTFPDIYEEVENLLTSHNLDKVDIVIHHGYFKHMLPPGIPEPSNTLDYDKFNKFVRGCVLNGHVHTPSVYKNVISVGSFDRLAHGEEEAKGFTEVTRNEEGVYSFKFIENKEANPFWSVNLQSYGDNSGLAFEYFNNTWMPKLEPFKNVDQIVRIRILSDSPGIIEGCMQLVRDNFSNVIVDRGAVSKREQLIENVSMRLDDLPEITPENVESLLLPILQKLDPNTDAQEVHRVLETCKKG